MEIFPLKYDNALTVENSWNDILVDVFKENNNETEIENISTKTLLAQKEINELEISWLKEKDQYKLTDGLGNTFFPDDDFSYRMTICILQNIVGLLIFCTVMKDLYPIELWIVDDFWSIEPRLRSAIISSIATFLLIIVSFMYSVRMMLKGKIKFDKANEKYMKQREELLVIKNRNI